MAPVGRQVLRLLRPATASLWLCAALLAATAGAQSGPAASPGGALPLPPTQTPVAPPALQVLDIQVEGLRTHTREAVLGAMSTRIGHPFDQASFEKDIRKLTSRSWFVHVVPKKEYVQGGVVISLSVVERPVLEFVRYLGSEHITEKRLAKETALKKGDPFDPYAVREGARKIESLYQSKGFNDVKVDIPEGTKPGDHGAVFLINEGKKLKFGKITFEGNSREIAPDGRLKKVIESRAPILGFIKGEVDEPKLEGDVDRLTDYYRSLGFFKAVVSKDVRYNADEDRLSVTFYINEGPRYQVRSVSFIGNNVFPEEAFAPHMKLNPGEPFDQSAMNKDIGTIKDIYGSNGYVFAAANEDLRFDLEPGILDIIYHVEEGQQYRIGDINITIKGDNPHTRASTILNRLDLRPGDIADIRKFRDSERRIKASGLFNVDPSKGELPRISFSPPDSVDNVARGKRRTGGPRTGDPDSFRGQSPDDGSSRSMAVARRPAAAPGQNGPRDLIVQISGQALPPAEAQDAPAQGDPLAGQGPTRLAPAQRQSSYPPRYPSPFPSAQPTAAGYVAPAAHQVPSTQTPRRYYPAANSVSPARRPTTQTVRGQSPDNRYGGYGGTAVNPISAGPQPFAVNQPASASGYATPAQYAEPVQDPLSPPSTPRDFGAQPGELPPPGLTPPPGDFLSGPEGLPPSQPALPVDVIASEAQTGRFMLGAGVNSNAGLIGSIVLDEQNFDWRRWPTSWEDFRSGRAFRGAGQKFRIEAAPGTVVQRYLFNFSEPYLFDTPVSFGLSGYYFNRYYRDWLEQRTGGRVTLGYQFTPDFSGNVGLRAEDVFIQPLNNGVGVTDIEAASGHSALYSVRTSLAHDTRDSTFLPTEGHYVTATFEYFMGTYFYPWFGLNTQQHWLLKERPDGTGRHTFSFYNQLGFAGANTPVYERFFAGGFSTLRGFQFRGASPMQPNPSGINAIVGGDFQFINSLEYMFPVTADDALKMVAFVDFGTVASNVNEIYGNQFRVAPGLGMRVTIPAISAAPIAIDFASPIQHANGDLIQNISFFVGVGR